MTFLNDELNNDVEKDDLDKLPEEPLNTASADLSDITPQDGEFIPGDANVPADPDILIQGLDDVNQSGNDDSSDDDGFDSVKNYCARCECEIPEYVTLCADCEAQIKKYPFSSKSIFLFILTVFFSCIGILGASANLPIAFKVASGDIAYYQDDIEKCYNCYNDAYKLSQALSNGLSAYTPENCVLFSSGSYALVNQFRAMYKLNGPYDAGSYISQFFGSNVPKGLADMKAEYDTIVSCYNDIDKLFSEYYEGIGENGTPDLTKLTAIVDNLGKAKNYPSYLLDYYRFTAATYASADVSVRKGYMDKVISAKPDALWLYASSAISLYKESENFDKALKICSTLLKKNPLDTSALAYSMSILRMQGDLVGAMKVYNSSAKLVEKQIELERQKAIILMLNGKYDEAEKVLIASYSDDTVTEVYANTMLICCHETGNTAKSDEINALLQKYNVSESQDVADYISGKTTVRKIFTKGTGDVK